MLGRKGVDMGLNKAVEQLVKSGGRDHILPIVQAGEPVLRQKAVRYDQQLTKKTLHRLIEAMHVTMLQAPGVGLAAPQIGLGLALAVVEDHARVDVGDGEAPEGEIERNGDDPREIAEFPFHVIINPSYRRIGDVTKSFYEGCLSVEGYQAVRRRWLNVTARWQDEAGTVHEEQLHGWPARIFQHETDHLSGELYIDKAQIRSLTTDENLEDYWCEDPVPTEAARRLGFRL
ncbi:MAG: peptide deformylase [Bifidobacterium sp.]|jgi:peptide deformylase